MCTDVASMGLNTPGLVLGVSLGMCVHSLISRQVTESTLLWGSVMAVIWLCSMADPVIHTAKNQVEAELTKDHTNLNFACVMPVILLKKILVFFFFKS